MKQKLILSFNQGNPDAGLFKPYIDYTKQMFEVLEFDVKTVLLLPVCEMDRHVKEKIFARA